MKAGDFRYFIFLTLFSIIAVFGCGDDATGPEGNRVAGTITFVNTSFLPNGSDGYYAIALYPTNESVPFCNQPIRKDTIDPHSRNTQSYDYEMTNVAAGTYYVGVAWIPSIQTNPPTKVLGTYGCNQKNMDSCSSYTRIEVPSYAGTGNVSFTSQTNFAYNINNRCP